MDRYFIFGFDDYYPSGGMNDFIESFNDKEKAIEYAKSLVDDTIGVYDMETKELIWKNYN